MKAIRGSLAWLAAAALLGGCGDQPAAPAAPPRVDVAERLRVDLVDVPQYRALAAEVATRDQAEALVRIPGVLVELDVREGDRVRAGQRLGRVADTRLPHEAAAFDAEAAAAAARATEARAELARTEYLFREGVYARARLEQAQAAARTAEAQVRAARERQAASDAVAGQGLVMAPAAGRVLKADVPAGSAVTPGMSIATVTAGPPVLRVDVPQSLAGRLGAGTPVVVRDSGWLDGRRGRVTQLYPAVAGGRVRADVEVPGLPTDLVGRRVTVLLDVGSRRGITVPARFVSTRFGLDYVDVLARDGAIAPVVVQTAPTGDARQVEILAGVAPGDVLAVRKRAR